MSLELGMSEMVSLLLAEVVQGIAHANLEQLEAVRSVREALNMPDEEFAQRFVTEEEVQAALDRVGAAQAVTFPRKQIVEQLSIRGVAVSDTAPPPQLLEVLRSQLRQDLAVRKRQELSGQVSAQALPRVIIDSGSLKARLAIRPLREPSDKAAAAASAASPPSESDEIVLNSPKQMIERLSRSRRDLPGLRLGVKPLTPAQALSAGDGYAEIQINFKTL